MDASEELVQALRDLDIPAEVLNARPENVERESEIVAQVTSKPQATPPPLSYISTSSNLALERDCGAGDFKAPGYPPPPQLY